MSSNIFKRSRQPRVLWADGCDLFTWRRSLDSKAQDIFKITFQLKAGNEKATIKTYIDCPEEKSPILPDLWNCNTISATRFPTKVCKFI